MPEKKHNKGSFKEACKDYRVWALFVIYAACFGIELTINNVAALYFADYFDLGLKTAGGGRGTVRLDEHFRPHHRWLAGR